MAEYKHIITVFKFNKKSHRGFYFKEATVDKFLATEACQSRLLNKNALGIITHMERKESDKLKGKIPVKDQILVNKSPISYISKLFKEKGALKAELTIFDPELFEGEVRSNIMFISGLLKSGVRIPTSAGIEAFYNPITHEGEIIYDIVGIDFTMAPDFEDSK